MSDSKSAAVRKLQAHNGRARLATIRTDADTPSSDKPKKDRVRTLFEVMLSACDLAHYAGHRYAIPKPSPWAGILGPPGIAQSLGEHLKRTIMRLARSHPDVGIIGEAVAKTVMDNLAADAEDGSETSISLRFHHTPAGQGEERVMWTLPRTTVTVSRFGRTAGKYWITRQMVSSFAGPM
jgi:hypothetical protein